MKYTAVIIEPRKHKAIEFVLQNALVCLNDDWKIIFFHGNNNIEYVTNITKKFASDRIQLIHLPINNLLLTEYSCLFSKNSIIYDYLTEIFIVFQTDSMMFLKNKHLLEKFLDYDYVGAPWQMNGYFITQ